MRKIVLLALFISLHFTTSAQQVRPKSSVQIFHELKQLNHLGTVMYLAAHPDDENTRLISYLVHHENIRTVYLSLTRGDGGQNILGTEQGAALGLIRTHELLEARKIDGAEQAFSPVIDFGFTKSPEETFQFWDKKKLVQNVVNAIQKYRPDIIICRFPTTGEGGHGQHTASAIVARDAYLFIENYNKKNPTQPLYLPVRLLFNSYQFGQRSTIKPGQFKVPINQYDPLLGEGYGEMAGRSRSVHKSQGAGTPQSVGISMEHFALMEGKKINNSLFDDVDLHWTRIGKPDLDHKISQVIESFDFEHPSKSISSLIKIRKEIKTLKNEFWREQKLKEIDNVILSCAGIMVEVLTQKPKATIDENLNLKIRLIYRGDEKVSFFDKNKEESINLQSDSLYQIAASLPLNKIPAIGYTQPYWLKYPEINNAYQFDTQYEGMPEAKNLVVIPLDFYIEGEKLEIDAPVSYKYLSPTRGDVVQRLRIVPEVSLEPADQLYIFKPNGENHIQIKVKANKTIPEFKIQLLLNGQKLAEEMMKPMEEGELQNFTFKLPKDLKLPSKKGNNFEFKAIVDGEVFNKTQHLIQYEHIPELQYFTESKVKVIEKNWKSTAQKIGYVEGVGDYVDDILKLTGLDVSMISQNELEDQAYLQQFDAIVLGIRALNTKDYLATSMKGLLHYCENGGTLIVQYNTNTGLVTDQIGPYPLTLSRDRVTEESAKVTILDPESLLLNYPNKITASDFENWVQERGLYFPSKWDKKYHTLFSMHDQNEKPLESAVLYADYGQGKFIYTSLAFFRQLPAGNEGAIRLFMNFLSAGK